MITAKDIHKKIFEKVKFGYNPEEVDAFLSQVENDLRLMEQQLSDSNDKVQLLADKVREYKETEDDLRNALVGAQKQAREVIAAANARAEQIEAEARSKVDSVKSEALIGQEEQLQQVERELEEKRKTLAEMQQMVSAFKQQLLNMYKGHLRQIAQLPDSPAAAAEKPASADAADTPASAETPAETAAPAEESVPAEAPAADAAPAAEQEKPAQSGVQFGSRRDDRDRRKRN